VINGFEVSLLAGFDEVAELIVKCCLLPFCWTTYCIYLSNTLKITKMQTVFKKHAVSCSVLFAVLKIFVTFNFPSLLKECCRMHFIRHSEVSVT